MPFYEPGLTRLYKLGLFSNIVMKKDNKCNEILKILLEKYSFYYVFIIFIMDFLSTSSQQSEDDSRELIVTTSTSLFGSGERRRM